MSRPVALLAVLLVAVAGCVGGVPARMITRPGQRPLEPRHYRRSDDATSDCFAPGYLGSDHAAVVPDAGRGLPGRRVGGVLRSRRGVLEARHPADRVHARWEHERVLRRVRRWFRTRIRIRRGTGRREVLHGDGLEVELDTALSGVHTIRVVAHADVNGNEKFEPETDLPCRCDGEVVQAGMERVNFSELAGASMPETTG